MTDSFRDRPDLQRRQIYHQQLLDSQRFGAHAQQEGTRAIEDCGGTGEGAWLGATVWVLAIVLLPITLLSALAALPAMLPILLADRALSGYWGVGFREGLIATAMGIFAYLVTTVVIAIGVYLLGVAGDDWNRLLHWDALAALQTSGLLLGSAVLCWRIGPPFSGVKGFFAALATSAVAMPLSVGLVLWAPARLM